MLYNIYNVLYIYLYIQNIYNYMESKNRKPNQTKLYIYYSNGWVYKLVVGSVV